MTGTSDEEMPEQGSARGERDRIRRSKVRQIVVGQGRPRQPIIVYKPSKSKEASQDAKDSRELDD